MTITEKLLKIQSGLNVPKNQYNDFGKYKYRSAEDILEAAKPLAAEVQAVILLTDEIINIGNRFYVRAKATLKDNDGEVFVYAIAREDETKKGMDGSQITGSATSYARKYALGGLFAIDDGKDADSQNNAVNAPTNPENVNTGSRSEKPKKTVTAPKMSVETALAYDVEIREGQHVLLGDMSQEQLEWVLKKAGNNAELKAAINAVFAYRLRQEDGEDIPF